VDHFLPPFHCACAIRRNSTSGLKSDRRFRLSDIDLLLVINSNYDATSHRFVPNHERYRQMTDRRHDRGK